jgi:pimeloyl-ACP methyl ester carboxylesterase
MPRLRANGTELYYEVRGTGPTVLLIMGATGDAGHFEAFAGHLADEFFVVTYDRRGYGRSPAPPGWRTTSPEEQADDAAALLAALGGPPAAVFGTSSGANFALCLLVRHPAAVSGAILHEPALFAFPTIWTQRGLRRERSSATPWRAAVRPRRSSRCGATSSETRDG